MNPKQIDIVQLFKQESIPVKQLLLYISTILKRTYLIGIGLIIVAGITSLIHFRLAPVEYETIVSVYVDQAPTGASAGLGGVGSMLGVNLDGMGSSASGLMGPDMYKDIIKSKAFLNEVITSRLPISRDNKQFSTLEHLLNGNKVDLTKKNLKDTTSLIKSEITPELILSNEVPPIVELNGSRANAMAILSNKIVIDVKGNLCVLKVKMSDPLISAVVSKLVLEKLIDYVTYYKTNKLRNNFNYLQERIAESEIKYKSAQSNLAAFKDRNIGSIFQSSQVSEQVLNNEVSSSFTIYNQLKGQLEQAKLELKKETPLFSVLEPISISETPSDPSLVDLIIFYTSFAFLTYLVILISLIVKPFINGKEF